jgi:hypothetical protein
MNLDPQFALFLEATRPVLSLDALCSDEERAVARALRWGRAGARQIRAIAADAGVGSRRAQEIVDHLIHTHRWPIGTSMSEPFGNYLIDSPADLEQTVELLRARGISNLARAAALKRMTVGEYLRAIQSDLNLGRA